MDKSNIADAIPAQPTLAALHKHDSSQWKRFSIGKQEFVAIPRTIWREFRAQNGANMPCHTIGFVQLMGLNYVLVPNDELQMTHTGSPPITSVLTSRELQIAHFVAEGKCDKVIAFDLGISEYTVHEHMRRIFRKLQISKRAALVARMIGRRLD